MWRSPRVLNQRPGFAVLFSTGAALACALPPRLRQPTAFGPRIKPQCMCWCLRFAVPVYAVALHMYSKYRPVYSDLRPSAPPHTRASLARSPHSDSIVFLCHGKCSVSLSGRGRSGRPRPRLRRPGLRFSRSFYPKTSATTPASHRSSAQNSAKLGESAAERVLALIGDSVWRSRAGSSVRKSAKELNVERTGGAFGPRVRAG
ncbi:hypothetical protein AOLI_G00142290 [Acnodon oligacanthus]